MPERAGAETQVEAVAPAVDPAPAVSEPVSSPGSTGSLSVARVLALQRASGNAAVSRLLARQPGTATPDAVLTTGSELGEHDLFLEVMFRKTTVAWSIPRERLDPALISLLQADPQQIAVIEAKIGEVLQPGGQPLHEQTYHLESPPVTEVLIKDLNAWPAARALPGFAARFAARSAALQATSVLYEVEQELEATGVDPATIDWAAQVEALKTAIPEEEVNVLDAAHADLYDLAVARLGEEAMAARPDGPTGGGSLHTAELADFIYYVLTAEGAPGPLSTDDMQRTHSELFLDQWLPKIEAIRVVPDGFDLEAYRPAGGGAMDAERETLLARFMTDAAPQAMTSYLLDRWAADPGRRSPEQFIITADIDGLRDNLLDHLADAFTRWALTQPGFKAALWSETGQKTAFDALTVIVTAGRATQQYNAQLYDRFLSVDPGGLDPDEWAIASDPAAYADRLTKLSAITQPLLTGLRPGADFEGSLLGWWQTAGAALGAEGSGAGWVGTLLGVLRGLTNLKSTIEQQKAAAREGLKSGLNTSFDAIAATIRAEAEFAAAFIKNEWIPMLKLVAKERITANKRELDAQLADWDNHREQAAARFRICGHMLDDLITKLDSGEAEEAELDGQILTKADLGELRTARDFVNGQADILTDPDKAADKKEDIEEAVAGFAEVLDNIETGEYDPLDYSSAVYEEARQRLGVGWYRDFTTVGQALLRFEVADENPFLAYAITRWKWQEQQKRLGDQFAIFIGLGLLTIASLIVPGVGGFVLGALDIALSVGMGIQQVEDADDILDLARLDTDGSVAGISVEQAEKALKTAWIGLGIASVLAAGIGALWARVVFKALGGSRVPVALTRLSALMKVDAVAAERVIAKVKDFEKAEELLEITGDSVLLGRMLDKTQNVEHLRYALMSGPPTKVMELLDLAGDAATLANILDHAPIANAERVLRLADDARAAVTVLRAASNNEVAIALLEWAGGSTGAVTRLMGPAQEADRLWRVSRVMDTAKLEGFLTTGRTLAELDDLVRAGVRVDDIEAGIGVPGGGAVPSAFDPRVPLPDRVVALLREYEIAEATALQKATPHEAGRLEVTFNSNRLPKKGEAVKKPAAQWAVDGAGDPGEVIARWEYLRTRYREIRNGLNPAAYPNKNLDMVTAAKLAEELRLGKLSAQLESDIKAVQALTGSGWTKLEGAGDAAALVRTAANELTFGSDTLTAYHVRKHMNELSLAERPALGTGFDAQLGAYVGSARRTIAGGSVAVEGDSLVFVRAVKDAAGKETVMTARVYIRDGHALITTYGGASP